ncbi:unnamed protein product [Prorocentrum cordatum]|uniref:Formyl transferase N-terminal domain-containing protein n=1 Tax=Prorocentrum cordatum TaxID=2364126 RepID=A0ABN9SJZ5_9DINO|nr:unnamed protein product [Polarella glacialis]
MGSRSPVVIFRDVAFCWQRRFSEASQTPLAGAAWGPLAPLWRPLGEFDQRRALQGASGRSSRCLTARWRIFATAKRHSAAHAAALEGRLEEICGARGVEYLGSVDANSAEVVERARKVDLVVIGGYDGILKGPVLEAPLHGVINTHLGVLPLNRGCCPTMWAQLHLGADDTGGRLATATSGAGGGVGIFMQALGVGAEIDFGGTLEVYVADPALGGLLDTNRCVYDALSEAAAARFAATLDAFEAGEPLGRCEGREAYHRKGMPNDAWLSFHWSGPFLRRFSLALDFAPYLPGRCRVASAGGEGEGEISVSVEGECEVPAGAAAAVGEVLRSAGDELHVRTARGAVLCRLRRGPLPPAGSVLSSGRPPGEASAGPCRHPIDELFLGFA